MPQTSTAFPLLTKFYGSAIIILVLAICCTCLVYALYFMNSSGLELHHASFFLRLKVRATRKKSSFSLEAQRAVLVTYPPGGVLFLEATKVSNCSNKKLHFKLTLVQTYTRTRLVMCPLFIVPDVHRTPRQRTPYEKVASKRPVYTGDFCRGNSMQFLSCQSCIKFQTCSKPLRYRNSFSSGKKCSF